MSDALHHLKGVHASLEGQDSISFYAVRGVLQEAIDEIERLTVESRAKDELLSQLFQIVACLADDLGIFEEDRVQDLLTEIHELKGKNFLPWASVSEGQTPDNQDAQFENME